MLNATSPAAVFSVRDPFLAGFLRIRGYRLVTVRPSPRGPEYYFEDRPERLEDLEAFIADQPVTVSLRQFARAVRAMRTAAATIPIGRR